MKCKEAGEYSIMRSFIIRMIKLRRLRMAGFVTRMGTGGIHMGFW
jgi:hypothetical protein